MLRSAVALPRTAHPLLRRPLPVLRAQLRAPARPPAAQPPEPCKPPLSRSLFQSTGPAKATVQDGMTRYPALNSSKGLLRGLDYFGTLVFAVGGTVTAGAAGMDVLGATIVGTITAVGGGTIRDLLIGNSPVFWIVEVEYLLMCIGTCVATFLSWDELSKRGFKDDSTIMKWADAFGVGAFAVIGAQNAIRKGLHPLVCIACGMMTATFGGMIRDVLCQKPPRILHSHAEIYATTAAVGAATYVGARAVGAPLPLRIWAGFATAVLARWVAWENDVKLPTWAAARVPAPQQQQPQQPPRQN